MKKILILANNDIGLYKFRKELIQELVKKFEVYISLPYGEFIPQLKRFGCKFIETPIDRRSINPIKDMSLLLKYRNIIKNIKPEVVLTYTIKPNIYGGLVSRISNVPYIVNITGLGTAVEKDGILQKIILFLYKRSLKKAECVFFQNEANKNFFTNKKITNVKMRLIPGSGVNLKEYEFKEYPKDEKNIRFLFIGRIMKAKGIDELLTVIPKVKAFYPNVIFEIVGYYEEDYFGKLKKYEEIGLIKYYGQQKDVREFIEKSHAVILPSYHEGMANVLLEAASSGRPILASRVPGCIETFDEGISGIGFKPKNVDSLFKAIIKFIELPYNEKKIMGINGRKKMENEFDRNKVIKPYMEEIFKIV